MFLLTVYIRANISNPQRYFSLNKVKGIFLPYTLSKNSEYSKADITSSKIGKMFCLSDSKISPFTSAVTDLVSPHPAQ